MAAWHRDHDNIVAFAAILKDGCYDLDDVEGLSFYYEKPWKWDDEHSKWEELGCPTESDVAWDEFVEYLDGRDS